MKKFKVLQLYRNSLRATAKVKDDALRQSIKLQLKDQYRYGAQQTDPICVKTSLAEAQRSLKMIRDICDQEIMNEAANMAMASSEQEVKKDPSEWLGSGPPNDVRGRVGTGWPWSR